MRLRTPCCRKEDSKRRLEKNAIRSGNKSDENPTRLGPVKETEETK